MLISPGIVLLLLLLGLARAEAAGVVHLAGPCSLRWLLPWFFPFAQTKLICYPRLFNAAINYDAKTFWPLKKQTANNNNNNEGNSGQQQGPVLSVASTLLGQLLAFVTHTLSPTVSICISLPPSATLCCLPLYMGRVIGGHVNQQGSSRGCVVVVAVAASAQLEQQ